MKRISNVYRYVARMIVKQYIADLISAGKTKEEIKAILSDWKEFEEWGFVVMSVAEL